jgi:hypothetical protein
LARQSDIVNIAAMPGDEALVLDAADGLANTEFIHGVTSMLDNWSEVTALRVTALH